MMKSTRDKKQKLIESGEDVSRFGGTLSVSQLEEYVRNKEQDAADDVTIYREYYVNRRSLRDVALEYGISHQLVKNKLAKMIGYIAGTSRKKGLKNTR